MRCRLCFHLEQCQVLPRLPKVYYPQASRRAYAEKARSCYEIGAYRGFIFKDFRTRKRGGKGFIPLLLKMPFNSVTKTFICTHKKAGAVAVIIGCRACSFFASFYSICVFRSRSGCRSTFKMLSILRLITPYSLTCFLSFP